MSAYAAGGLSSILKIHNVSIINEVNGGTMEERYYIIYKLMVLSGPHTKLVASERFNRLKLCFDNLELYRM